MWYLTGAVVAEFATEFETGAVAVLCLAVWLGDEHTNP